MPTTSRVAGAASTWKGDTKARLATSLADLEGVLGRGPGELRAVYLGVDPPRLMGRWAPDPGEKLPWKARVYTPGSCNVTGAVLSWWAAAVP